jgi:hypothetical protein
MSATTTITMTGNSTGYGLYSGNEVFDLSGYDNTVLLNGANDRIAVQGGEYDAINLNSSGFAKAVNDQVYLNDSSFDTVSGSSALTDSEVTIAGSGGPNTISLINHGGITDVALGYTGDPTYEWGLGIDDVVRLNGDASNQVVFTAGGYAEVSIGAAGDGFSGFASHVSLYGMDNSVSGGDEAFTVTERDGGGNSVSLGNGANTVVLAGNGNTVDLGNGANHLYLSNGFLDTASLGTGNNAVTAVGAGASLAFAAGDSGAVETISMSHGALHVSGGDENFTIIGGVGSDLVGRLGDGDNTISLATGHAQLVIGASPDNTADNTVSFGRGFNFLQFNGGDDQVTLADAAGAKGYDNVVLNGTMLGTNLTTAGVFDKVTLANDANATINDTATNGGMSFILDADKAGGFGTVIINGLANDDLAHITLVGAGTYTVSVDQTAAGGITLNFAHGSVDLVGLQSVPNTLIS